MTPFQVVSAVSAPAAADKAMLVRVTRRLERRALLDRPPAVAACLQDARFLTERTLEVYRGLAPARLYARGLHTALAQGVTGVPLDEDDPLVDEWTMVLPCPGGPVVFAATDLGAERWTWSQSEDPDVVAECGRLLGL